MKLSLAIILLLICSFFHAHGQTEEYFLTENGDSVITGIPIPVIGKQINPDSTASPKTILAGMPIKVLTNTNVYPVGTPVVVQAQPAFIPNLNSSNFVLLNYTRDTIPTGVPLDLKGVTVPATLLPPTVALPPRFKDNAIRNIQYLDVEQGLASSFVETIYEDSRGNIWFGTYSGISKYDGKSFQQFTTKQGLSYNIVGSILEDKSGNMWFGYDGGGVSKYDGKSFTHYTVNNGLNNDFVLYILQDQSGNIWFATYGGGVSKYDGKSFTHYTTKEGLSNNRVWSMVEDQSGNIWFGTYGGGLSKYDGKSFTNFTTKEGLNNNYIRSLLADKMGNIWIGTEGAGVCKFDGQSFTKFTTKQGLSNNYVNSIIEDQSGNIWFGTYGGGVCKYDGKSFTHLTTKEGMSHNYIRTIMEDKSGNLWFATDGGGACKYDRKSFSHFTTEHGLRHNYIRYILEDKRGDLWFGGNGGVCKYDGKSFNHYSKKQGLSHNFVFSILEDRGGNLWFGTLGGGVCKYDGKSFTNFGPKHGLSYNAVKSMMEDRKGNLWFGTEGGGISRYDGKSFTHFTTSEGLISNSVYAILEDHSGNIWFGTYGGGACKYDGKSFTHFTTREGLSNNFVRSIFEDHNNTLWFGTDGGGINKFDGETFTHFTTNQGLSNNSVWSIMEDESNNIWVGTETGLSLIFQKDAAKKLENQLEGEIYKSKNGKEVFFEETKIGTFGKPEGLKASDFWQNSVLLDSKNCMWWGSGKSLTMLDMNDFTMSEKPPIIHLNRIEIDEQFMDYHQSGDSANAGIKYNDVPAFYNYPLNLELPYDRNHLTFFFTAIDWHAPHKIKYSYKIEPLHNNWSEITSDIKADYRSLPYGKYTFKVRAIGQSQEWSDPIEYRFIIHPPWWHTWWARTSYGLLAIVGIWVLLLLQTKRLKVRQKELVMEVRAATVELRDKNKEIATQRDIAEEQKIIVEELHQEVTDSIEYAAHIQNAILTGDSYWQRMLPEHFVFFKPRDIVSGDFYWAYECPVGTVSRASTSARGEVRGDLESESDRDKEVRGKKIWIAADCTGHGVPGGFMSMLGNTFLNEIVIEQRIHEASNILNSLREHIIKALSSDMDSDDGFEMMDGMDLALCILHADNTLEYAGANNPLWIISKKNQLSKQSSKTSDEQVEENVKVITNETEDLFLHEIKADKQPIGKYMIMTPFVSHKVKLVPGDQIYIFTDGFSDQFGGPKFKKYMARRLRKCFFSIADKPMHLQKELMLKEFDDWRKDNEQVDDVCVIGVRV